MSLIKFATGEVLDESIIVKITPKYTAHFSRTIEGQTADTDLPTVDLIREWIVATRWIVTTTDGDEIEVEKSRTSVDRERSLFKDSVMYRYMDKDKDGKPKNDGGLKLKVLGHMRELYAINKSMRELLGAGGMIPTNVDTDHIPGIDDEPVATPTVTVEDIQASFDHRVNELSALLHSAGLLGAKVVGKTVTDEKSGEQVEKVEFEGVYEIEDHLRDLRVKCDVVPTQCNFERI